MTRIRSVSDIIRSKIKKSGYELMVKNNIIPDFMDESNHEIVNIHPPICPLNDIDGQLFGCIMNDVLDSIIRKQVKSIEYFRYKYPSCSFPFENMNELISCFAFVWYDELMKSYFCRYKNVSVQEHVYSSTFQGITDYICDDTILDMKCYQRDDALCYKTILQLILYYCLYTKGKITNLAIYDFYKGNIIMIPTESIDVEKVLKYVQTL
jgi:hypothetical protein